MTCLVVAVFASGCRDSSQKPSTTDARPLVRIGYSTLTPLHTALGLVMERTPVLAKHGLRGAFVPVVRGKDQHRAAASGKLDATFSCEVAAMVHLHRLPSMNLTGSPGELGEMALVVPKGSSKRAVADLAGAMVGIQGGASAQMMARRWLAPLAGNVTTELLRAHPKQGADRLIAGELDAAVLWDPWLTLFVKRHGLKVVKRAPFWSVVALFGDRQKITSAYHAALSDALAHIAANLDEVASLVAEVSPFPADVVADVLKKNKYISLKVKEKPSMSVGDDLRARLAECERFARDLGAVPDDFALAPRLRAEMVAP